MRRIKFKYGIVPVLFIIICGCGDKFDDCDAYADYLSIGGLSDGKMILFNERDSLKSFFVDSDKDGIIEYLNNDDKAWLKVDTHFKKGRDTINISASKFVKYPKERREADLRINVGDYSRQITISQESLDKYVKVSSHEITLDKDVQEDCILVVESNTDWTSTYREWKYDDNRNFYHVAPSKGSILTKGNILNDTIFLRGLQTNKSRSVLKDTVYFYPEGCEQYPELRQLVEIRLPKKPFLDIKFLGSNPDDNINFEWYGGEEKIFIYSNINLDLPQTSKNDWVKFNYEEDDEEPTLTIMKIHVDSNFVQLRRTKDLIIKVKNLDTVIEDKTIPITQKGRRY